MRRIACGTTAALMVVLASGGSSAAQRGAGPGPGAATQVAQVTGTIVGRVVDAGTGQPVAEAQVTLAIRADAATGPSARLLTGPDGRFVVRDVPVGNGQLQVSAPGYMNGSYGQVRPGGPPLPVIVTAENRIVQATVRLWKYAAVSGTITDDANAPAVNVTVWAFRRTFASGLPRYAPSGLGRTDDRGAYRISGLAPGDYVVVVQQTQTTMPVASMNAAMDSMLSGMGMAAAVVELAAAGVMPTGGTGVQVGDQLVSATSGALPVMSGDGRMAAYLTQYFPAAATPAAATTVTLASGDDRGGVDIRMPLVATAGINGTVIGPDGPMAGIQVRVVPAGVASGNDLLSDVARGATGANGAFQLYGIPAGPHVIKVLRVPRPALPPAVANNPQIQALLGGRSGPSTASDALTLFADMPVSVERDITGLVITLSAGASVSGRVEFVGTAPPVPMAGVTLTLAPQGDQSARLAPTRVAEDGRFTMTGYPPGKYLLTPAGRAPGWFVRSAMVEGVEALDQHIELTGEDIGNVIITYGDRQTTLSGTVTAANGAPAAATVIVFPAAHREWIARGMVPRLTRNVRAQAKGTFTISGLPARDYLVVALADEDVPDAQDPRVYEALARAATSITISEDGPRTVTLKVAQVVR
ncbi:MAG: carboxypeptidase regulatory-like domain-containing protein [Acidobacteria bacterium]|nr:carboxypeptidase regulatory-like domain-containing protein [Acidobacteriota bacterium]